MSNPVSAVMGMINAAQSNIKRLLGELASLEPQIRAARVAGSSTSGQLDSYESQKTTKTQELKTEEQSLQFANNLLQSAFEPGKMLARLAGLQVV